jgi:hypothetical protein
LRESIESADSAVIAMGTFCNFSDRNCAVTTISSSESLGAATGLSAAKDSGAMADSTPATASAAQQLPCADAQDFINLRLNEELIFPSVLLYNRKRP